MQSFLKEHAIYFGFKLQNAFNLHPLTYFLNGRFACLIGRVNQVLWITNKLIVNHPNYRSLILGYLLCPSVSSCTVCRKICLTSIFGHFSITIPDSTKLLATWYGKWPPNERLGPSNKCSLFFTIPYVAIPTNALVAPCKASPTCFMTPVFVPPVITQAPGVFATCGCKYVVNTV